MKPADIEKKVDSLSVNLELEIQKKDKGSGLSNTQTQDKIMGQVRNYGNVIEKDFKSTFKKDD